MLFRLKIWPIYNCKVLKAKQLRTLKFSKFAYYLKYLVMQPSKQKAENLATPGKPMSQEAFENLIKEAEEGELLTELEFDKRFEEWRLNQI